MNDMKNTVLEKRETLRRYAVRQLDDPSNRISPEQWMHLLNCYVKHESAETCAAKTGLDPIQINIRYCDLSIELLRLAVNRLNSPKHTVV